MIYADNEATTKTSELALNAMLPYIKFFWGNPSSLYNFGQNVAESVESARKVIADCIGANVSE